MKQHNEIINADLYLRSVSQVIGSSYVRSNSLTQLVYETYGNSSISEATKLNIFIDLASVLHGLYSEHHRITIENVTDISSGIINMCGHYRSFFKSALGVDTRIFLIYTTNTCDINVKFVGDYNSEIRRKISVASTIKMINNNMKLLEILCPYLPAIYYIDSPNQFEASVIIAHLIETLNDPNPNLIISHDMYPLQLCTQYRWTSYLYPKKSKINGELVDTSWMIPVNDKTCFREEFWRRFAMHRNISEYSYNSLCKISPINYSLLNAIIPFPERNLKAIAMLPSAIKFISYIIGGEDIKIQSAQFMNDPDLVAKYPVANIEARYKAMDVQYMLPFYRNNPESNNIKLLDLNDISAVNNICAKYYSNNPIDLQKL